MIPRQREFESENDIETLGCGGSYGFIEYTGRITNRESNANQLRDNAALLDREDHVYYGTADDHVFDLPQGATAQWVTTGPHNKPDGVSGVCQLTEVEVSPGR